ncbi:MAG: cofactor-independent phosphoglycerate mutase [Clostridia bacterium]|nr:cofactor-independent phosphoglycerate mutase [Clostridia bacterium]
MKYVVLLCDGMADVACADLQNKTPMEAAHKPAMDSLAAAAEVGMAYTVPDGLSPGSDVANLSVLGYCPEECYTGRSPLEAANIGIDLADDDVALRCNLVTLSENEPYDKKNMDDYCAGDIHTAEADEIIRTVQGAFGGGEFDFYTGTAYRHCLVWHGGKTAIGKLTPPHDISGQVIGEHLAAHPDAAPLLDMMKRSTSLLANHPVNEKRRQNGQNPANAIWLWGHGKRPSLQKFEERFGVKGAMVSAVDLLKGIARLTDMTVCEVAGATGYLDTNFEGKRQAAVHALANGHDMVYIHVEAPDECGHRGEIQNKVRAIEEIDKKILAPLLEELKAFGDYAILIMPDHPTPLHTRTHSAAAVPYLLYRSNGAVNSGLDRFTEQTAQSTNITVAKASDLMGKLLMP